MAFISSDECIRSIGRHPLRQLVLSPLRPAGLRSAEPHPQVEEQPSGAATIETYTVLFDRDGTPTQGIVIGRTASDRRFIANTPPDRALLEPMTEQEMIGTRGHVAHDAASGINTFTPD